MSAAADLDPEHMMYAATEAAVPAQIMISMLDLQASKLPSARFINSTTRWPPVMHTNPFCGWLICHDPLTMFQSWEMVGGKARGCNMCDAGCNTWFQDAVVNVVADDLDACLIGGDHLVYYTAAVGFNAASKHSSLKCAAAGDGMGNGLVFVKHRDAPPPRVTTLTTCDVCLKE
jgi:hypothetical protein